MPPPLPPAIIAGAPAVAANTGQLLFVLPGSTTVVPATIIVMPSGELRPPPTWVRARPARPRLRDPIPFVAG
jgi:hypothetical protein